MKSEKRKAKSERRKTNRATSLSYDGEAGKFKEELLHTGVVETNGSFGVLPRALYFDDLTPTETLVLDDRTWGERRGRWAGWARRGGWRRWAGWGCLGG